MMGFFAWFSLRDMIKRLLLLGFLLTLFSTGAFGQRPALQRASADSLTRELGEVYKRGQFVGFSVAIVGEDGVQYEHGIGFANAAQHKRYTQHTIQNIASVSKTLVGVALLKAQELGKLKLDDPINKYLPFKVSNPHFPAVEITIRQLAAHTSSIADNDTYLKKGYILKANQDLSNLKTELEDEQVLNPVDSAVALPVFLRNYLSAQGKWHQDNCFTPHRPGEIFEYSNVGAALAAYVIEAATGKNFSAFTKEYILRPLKMKASGWRFDQVDFSNYATLYSKPGTAMAYYTITTYPDGNFITSAHDLAYFLMELVKGYAGHGTILNQASYKELFTAKLTAINFLKRGDKNPYGDTYNYSIFMGFSVAGNIGHTGGDPGVSTIMFFNPSTKVGRLLLVNTNINDKKGNDEFYAIWNVLGKHQAKPGN